MAGKNQGLVNKFTLLVAKGSTIEGAARAVGISKRQGITWTQRDGFHDRVAELRRKITDDAVARLNGGLVKAADTFTELMEKDNKDNIRLMAGKALIDALISLRNHADHAERLAELERLVKHELPRLR